MVSEGDVRRRYAAGDRGRDPGPDRDQRPAAGGAGGWGDRPALTLVGDGQQSIYPGGFSLRSLGVEVRGRSFVLREAPTGATAPTSGWRPARSSPVTSSMTLRTSCRAVRALMPYAIRPGGPHRGSIASHLPAKPPTGSQRSSPKTSRPGRTPVMGWRSRRRTRRRPSSRRRLRSCWCLRCGGWTATPASTSDAVWVGTFHRSEGLEFKRVYIAGLDAKSWPPPLPGLEPQAQQDADGRATRAAFVAMKRARDQLDLVTAGEPARQVADAAWAFDR